LAELTVLPEFPDDMKAALKQALIPTLQEAGCEGMFETSREGDLHRLVFFEIFSSSAAHKFHREQDYTKWLFTTLEGKLAVASMDRAEPDHGRERRSRARNEVRRQRQDDVSIGFSQLIPRQGADERVALGF
jgi:quinol monooxygenase YgiN